MATLLLVRHGRTTANRTGILAGRTPGVRLDDVGQQQVEAAGERLADLPLAAVITSPLERCRQTAKALAARHPGLKVRSDRGLMEVDYGEWTNQELKVLGKLPLWKTVQGHPSAVTFPDGEAMAAMAARAVVTVRRHDAAVEAEHGAEALWVAVSHGDVIKAILADALGIHLDAFQRIVVDPASISVVRYTPGRPFVVSTNTHTGSLAHVAPPKKRGSRRPKPSSDAAIGGGAGPTAHG